MHIDLYQSLKSIKIGDDEAAATVRSLEGFVTVKISEANKGLEARMDSLQSEIKSMKWLLGFIGTILAIIGLAPFIAKLS